jgi:DNA-binding NtrC family response regulator/predicted hydrocarbon binding protein
VAEPEVKQKLQLRNVASEISFSSEEGKVWLNEQRIILFSLAALGKFRREVYDTIGPERCKAFFIRLGYQVGILDGELARQMEDAGDDYERFMLGPTLHALRGMVLPTMLDLDLGEKSGNFYCEVQWDNSYEVEICHSDFGMMDEPACWNLVGYASGYASVMQQREIFFQEVECRASGDERCRGIGKPAEEWDNYHHYKQYYEPDGLLEELRELQSHVDVLRTNWEDSESLAYIIGQSKPFRHALNMVSKASGSKVSVLLLGETGVGKEVLARALHKSGERADKPFIAINCAAIPPDLIESELFGVEKGAFTGAAQARAGRFERADKGTIFLDEVVELTPRAQASLLRVLQEHELERLGDNKVRQIDVRVVAATNEDLSVAVSEGRFRADLYYRLSAYPINIPSLRQRKEDIPLFVSHFLEKYQALYNKKVLGISDRGMEQLSAYRWPGNIRELENVVERALILAEPNSMIGIDAIFPDYVAQDDPDGHSVPGIQAADLGSGSDEMFENLLDEGFSLESFERGLIEKALGKAGGNVSKAARLVGMTRPAFSYRLKKMQEHS